MPTSERFDQWIAEYGHLYEDEAEKAKCMEIFAEKVKYLSFNNNGVHSYIQGINDFSEQTLADFKGIFRNDEGNAY